MERIDAVVVGAGAVGLAVARELALRGRETLVLEAGPGIGNGTSSRNSEVIHAGLYDAPGSFKAPLCVAGREALYPYCESRGVGHRRCGKLVVAATPAQVETLKAIEARATANGVRGLRWLSGAEARELEPALHGEAALLSTVTGIIDSHALMLAYQGDLENAGGAVVAARAGRARGHERRRLRAARRWRRARRAARGLLVNAAGLHAPALARAIAGLDPAPIPRPWFAKGNYFALARRSPFTHLIYPVPEPGGLGVHLTLDLAGQARFGPDVEWLDVASPDAIDYARRPGTRRAVLRRGSPLLAGARGRRAGAGLQRRAAEAAGAGRAGRATSCCKGPRRTALPAW